MSDFSIARVSSSAQVRSAVSNSKEFGAWAKRVTRDSYGLDVDAQDATLGTSINELMRPSSRLYVARFGDTAVGVGGLKRLPDEVAEIKRVYVRPPARGHGVGRALVERLLDDARHDCQ